MSRYQSLFLIVLTIAILYVCSRTPAYHGRAGGIWMFIVLISVATLVVAAVQLTMPRPKVGRDLRPKNKVKEEQEREMKRYRL